MHDLNNYNDLNNFRNNIPDYKMPKDVRKHLISKLNIPAKEVTELASAVKGCIGNSVDLAYNCCLLTIWAQKSKHHQQAVEYVIAKHLDSDHEANKFLTRVAERTFAIDSPRTAHLPEPQRNVIAECSGGNAIELVDGDRIINVYSQDGSDECDEIPFKDLTLEQLDQCITSSGIIRSKSKQWRYLASRDRTAVDRHIRDGSVWVKQGRKSMSDLLIYVDELIKHVTSEEVAIKYIAQLSTITDAAKSKLESL